jgi:hypothetical protein
MPEVCRTAPLQRHRAGAASVRSKTGGSPAATGSVVPLFLESRGSAGGWIE